MSQPLLRSALALLTAALTSIAGHVTAAQTLAAPAGYTLVWSDEFNTGNTPDPSKWTYDIGGNGWGNQELEYYTNRLENVKVEAGNLVITARQETYTGADGVTRNFTSARLRTQGLFSQAYGRFEARIKLPVGQGIWPAFWMLGDNFPTDGWPRCGEIDIVENVGKEPSIVHGSLHGPGPAKIPAELTAAFGLPADTDSPIANAAPAPKKAAVAAPPPTAVGLPPKPSLGDDFHLYAVEWEPGAIRFFLDAHLYATFTSAQWPAGGTWVFDHPFFLLLNIAVGGKWPGSPDPTTVFPQKMLVDYVRVYKKNGETTTPK
jgi:beta-glucanase (GH16 family)